MIQYLMDCKLKDQQIRRNKKFMINKRKLAVKCFLGLLLLISLQQLGQGGYIYAKAVLAQYLIESAWQKTLAGEHQVKPWSWADTWPVAKLTVKNSNTNLFILAGDNGRTLAFGPGYRFGTELPGDDGNSIISGHRDTHFSFLRDIKIEDVIEIQNTKGDIVNYRVKSTEVVSVDDGFVIANGQSPKITLVTCYPFNAILTGGKLRYIVTANKIDELLASSLPVTVD
jgi:sortase A